MRPKFVVMENSKHMQVNWWHWFNVVSKVRCIVDWWDVFTGSSKPNFTGIRSSVTELWLHHDFQGGGHQPCWIWFRVIVAHPRSVSCGLCFGPQILAWLDLQFCGDSAIFIFWYYDLKLPIYVHLYGVLRAFSPNDVIYHSNPQKAPPCTETSHLSHKEWQSVQRFDLSTCLRKRQDGTVKTSHNGIIFHSLGEKPHWTDLHLNLHSSCRLWRDGDVCKVLDWNFLGLRFYRGDRIFTTRAYARAVLGVVILSVCPSVRLSVCLSHTCIVTKLNNALQIFLYHTKEQSLCYSLLWYQEWLVGDAPFPLKYAFKVTHPFRKTPTSTDFRS